MKIFAFSNEKNTAVFFLIKKFFIASVSFSKGFETQKTSRSSGLGLKLLQKAVSGHSRKGHKLFCSEVCKFSWNLAILGSW